MTSPLITVSMPTWRTPIDLLFKAIESVLTQTVDDLLLVVVGDGDDPVDEILEGNYRINGLLAYDDRIVYLRLPRRRGRYFADAVVARAAQSEWFTVHDADDWSEPNRYEKMLDAAGKKAVSVVAGGEMIHRLDGTVRARQPYVRGGLTNRSLTHLWHMSALYQTHVIDGLIHPGFQVGYDSLLSSMLLASTEVAVSRSPLYHRVARDGSLTKDPVTGIDSAYRLTVRDELLELKGKVRAAIAADGGGRGGFKDHVDVVKQVIADDVNEGTKLAIEVLASDLKRLIAERVRAERVPDEIDASDVVVTILTGGRPDLLEDTIRAALEHAPGLLESATVLHMHNGDDRETDEVLEAYAQVLDRRVRHAVPRGRLPTATAMYDLAQAATAMSYGTDIRYWLHLEDDWRASPETGWLETAKRILDSGTASQVRLRHHREPVLDKNMTTGQPINWRDQGDHLLADAHLTFNPSLVRIENALDMFPATSERDAMRKWREKGHLISAQLVPGCFRHTGGGARSLRKQVGA